MVVATLNPFEQQGIYPLPESQLDRSLQDQLDMSRRRRRGDPARSAPRPYPGRPRRDPSLLDVARLDAAQRELDSIRAPDDVVRYIVEIIRNTRQEPVSLARAPPSLDPSLSASKAHARPFGRDLPSVATSAAMAPYVLPTASSSTASRRKTS